MPEGNTPNVVVFLLQSKALSSRLCDADRLSTDGATQQLSGFATAEQFEAAFGQQTSEADFSREPAADEGSYWDHRVNEVVT